MSKSKTIKRLKKYIELLERESDKLEYELMRLRDIVGWYFKD